jgi:alkaline phosphatase D
MHRDRRELIKAAGALALVCGLAPQPVLAAPAGANPFTLGVAAGDPWPDGFVIWTRLAPRPFEEHGGMPQGAVKVGWEVSEDARFSNIVRKGEALARPELAHSVHVELSGLRPHRHYWYRFTLAGGEASPVGMARTAPAGGDLATRVRIGIGGCQHWEAGFFDAWGHMAREPDLDLIFHYGDYIYEGRSRPIGKAVVRQHLGEEIYSLDDYRRRHAQYRSDPHLQAAHAACAFAVSFDDHEVDNNWAGDLDQDGVPPELFRLRRLAALQAWYEHMPVRRAQLPRPDGITAFRRLDYGGLLRMHVLDTRSFRSDQPCDDGKIQPCSFEAHVSPTMLGTTQEAWLDEGLGNAAVWNLIAQQVLVTPYQRHKAGEAATFTSYDTWDGYRPARARLIDSIRRHELTNVVIASGDFHRNIVGVLPGREEAPEGKAAAVEFLATSITSNGDGGLLSEAERELSTNPHLRMINNYRGYQVFDISPKRWKTEVKVIDRVSTPGGSLRTLASYAVTPDQPKVLDA